MTWDDLDNFTRADLLPRSLRSAAAGPSVSPAGTCR